MLVKHFADRQVRVAPGVIAFLVRRMERSFAAAGALAARLDRLSLSAGRPIGIALARPRLANSAEALALSRPAKPLIAERFRRHVLGQRVARSAEARPGPDSIAKLARAVVGNLPAASAR